MKHPRKPIGRPPGSKRSTFTHTIPAIPCTEIQHREWCKLGKQSWLRSKLTPTVEGFMVPVDVCEDDER